MLFIDTHTHLYSEEFDNDRQEVMSRSAEVGVTRVILPGVDAESRPAQMAMAKAYPCCSLMVGLHPTCVNDNPQWRHEIELIEQELAVDSSRFCAVGEIGLDLYWSSDFANDQIEALETQLELALKYNLPVDIHTRDAWDLTIEVLQKYKGRGLRGVIHAFSGEVHHIDLLLEIGDFMFGIGGVVTFKKSKLAPVVAAMPLERIVLETDAPYLTPAPHRGKRNESAYIPHIAEAVAALHAVSLEEVAKVTTANACRMFGL